MGTERQQKYNRDDIQQCNICDKSFQTKDMLSTHIRNTHILAKRGISKPKYKCGFCGVLTRSQSDLTRHMKTVHT